MAQPGGSTEFLFIGGVHLPDEQGELLYKSKGVIQFAANAMQWKIIDGVEAIMGRPISILNMPFVGAYPRLYKDAYIVSKQWSHTPGALDQTAGFMNIFAIKQLWRALSGARFALKWCRKRPGHQKVALLYSVHFPFLFAACAMKWTNPYVHVCLIAPDLPEYMDPSGGSQVYKMLKWIEQKLVSWLIKEVDSFVLLTTHMAEKIRVRNKPWIVVEGMVSLKEAEIFPSQVRDHKEKRFSSIHCG